MGAWEERRSRLAPLETRLDLERPDPGQRFAVSCPESVWLEILDSVLTAERAALLRSG